MWANPGWICPPKGRRAPEIDKVFIGSCTNARIEDLREVAKIAKGKKVAGSVEAMVVPGSGLVKAMAEEEGIPYRLFENNDELDKDEMDSETFLRMMKENNHRGVTWLKSCVVQTPWQMDFSPELSQLLRKTHMSQNIYACNP